MLFNWMITVQALAELYSFKPQLCLHKSSQNADKSSSSPPDASRDNKARDLGDEDSETRRWTVQHVSLHLPAQYFYVISRIAIW